jgi:6-phosphofructokinase 1
MSGRTNMVVGFWNHQFTHVPISLAASQRKKIDPKGMLWNSVLAPTPPRPTVENVLRNRRFGKV